MSIDPHAIALVEGLDLSAVNVFDVRYGDPLTFDIAVFRVDRCGIETQVFDAVRVNADAQWLDVLAKSPTQPHRYDTPTRVLREESPCRLRLVLGRWPVPLSAEDEDEVRGLIVAQQEYQDARRRGADPPPFWREETT